MKRIGIIGILLVILVASLPVNGLAANELIVNGGFESASPFGWTLWHYADEITVEGIPGNAHSGSSYLVMGGIGYEGTGKAHAEQTFSPAVYAHTDLTFWAKGYSGPSTVVVWVFYELGVERHTLAVTADWSKITVPIDKTMAVQAIRIATYDEEDKVYTELKYIDDVSMMGGFFVIPEFPYGSVLGVAAMFAALVTLNHSKHRHMKV